jgi:hypothetical protein
MHDLTATRVLIPGVLGPYDAHVNLAHDGNRFASPLFTLDTVREIATRTQELADECGSNDVITAHVIDGDPHNGGEPRAVVLTVNWQYWDEDGCAKKVTHIAEPTLDGLYAFPGSSWPWEFQIWDCPCGEENRWHITQCPQCDRRRDIEVAVPDGMVATRVCIDGPATYPAYVAKDARYGQLVDPYFTLDTVRELAADTQKAAVTDPRSSETIHVLETAPDREGNRGTIVLHADWVTEDAEGPEEAARIIAPNDHSLYRVGPDWHWSLAWWWCICDTENGWHFDQCSQCGLTRAEQPKPGLEAAAWKVGRLLRAQAPGVTAALIDLTDQAYICEVFEADGRIVTHDDTGPFDTETLGQADEVLRKALDEATLGDLHSSSWEHTPDDESTSLYRITFPAARTN